MSAPAIALVVVLIGLAGCGGSASSNEASRLGRALGAEPASASRAPAPNGDPPAERNGRVPLPLALAAKRSSVKLAVSPRAALRRFAMTYTNWRASGLDAHEREVAALAVGEARATAEATAAAQAVAAELNASKVRNEGVVVAIAPNEEPANGRWVVVTKEATSGVGAYGGLPALVHVTFARTVHLHGGWAVSEWQPQS